MFDTPDFNAIALRVLVEIDPLSHSQNPETTQQALAIVVTQLRLMWNARGAADLAELDAVLAGAAPSMKAIDQILRSLDQ